VCYTLQIYCDFAGYSDMAIGLGRMFGFEFMENFNFPYLAKSVKEFWRRWHISLSTFFRDYVYIPLGGNRVKKSRQYVNLIGVFFLTGLWHGANWTFIIWGLFHGFFLLAERLFLDKLLERTWKPLANLYTLLVVMFAWVLFRNPYLGTTLNYWKAMFDFNLTKDQITLFLGFMNTELYFAFGIAVLGSFGFFNFIGDHLTKALVRDGSDSKVLALSYHVLSTLFYAIIFILSALYLISGTYNPFIYYQF
jgi:alginate O-acetyltransferase complex protein AlgI